MISKEIIISLLLISVNGFQLVCSESKRKVFTCCSEQSGLNANGYCQLGGYEFENDIFQSKWEIPNILKYEGEAVHNKEFKLETRAIWCTCTKMETFPITLSRSRYPTQDKNKTDSSGWIQNESISSIKFSNDGKLILSNGVIYETDQYCLNTLEIHGVNGLGLDEDIYKLEVVLCMEHCLPMLQRRPHSEDDVFSGEVLHHLSSNKIDLHRTSKCEDFEREEIFYSESNGTDDAVCRSWTSFYYSNEHLYLIYTKNNQTIAIEDETYPWNSLPKSTYCKISLTTTTDNTGDDYVTTNGNHGVLKFCIPQLKKIFYGFQEIYAIISGISSIFLLFNLAIYFSLRHSLSISGWTEAIYSLALYCYFILSIVGLLIVPEDLEITTFCYTLSLLLQFLELASGATLVCLSFDIFWTFCKYDSWSYTDDPKVSKLRLSIYILFSTFFPTSIVIYGVVKNKRPWEFDVDGGRDGIPHYGLFHCTAPDWFLNTYLQFSLQGLNLLLSLISAYVIINKKKPLNLPMSRSMAGAHNDAGGTLNPDRQDIFSKLFVFIFIFWVMNLMQFFFAGEIFVSKWYLVGFRLANYSQGILAFFVLICNRRTLKGIRRREWDLKELFCHACCTCTNTRKIKGLEEEEIQEESLPISPLMKSMKLGSLKRSTVRGNNFY